MSKFKVGDKIIAKKNTPYVITDDGWTGVVTDVKKNGSFTARGEGLFDKKNEFRDLHEKYFELAPADTSKIIITTDGIKTVTARLYEGKKVIKTAEAKCSPEDKFDFGYGAALALERLMGHKLEEEKYFTGKVRCVNCKNGYLTKGKIYEFVNGYSVDDDGDQFPISRPVNSIQDLNSMLWSDFEEVTEEDEPIEEDKPDFYDALEALEALVELGKLLEKFQ